MSDDTPNNLIVFEGKDGFRRYLKAKTHRFDDLSMMAKPKKKTFICNLFPVGHSSAIVGRGGVGKTLLLTHLLVQHLLSHPEDIIVFVSAEDSIEDYQAKLYGIQLGLSDDTIAAVSDRIVVISTRGDGLKMTYENHGTAVPSSFTNELATYIAEDLPNCAAIVFETVSRFSGDENNLHLEAFVAAADFVAIKAKAAAICVHHTGKQQSRDADDKPEEIDLYAGRNGSAFGDNTRSFVMVSAANRKHDFHKIKETARDLDEWNREQRLFAVRHIRNSYGPRQPDQFFVIEHLNGEAPVLKLLETRNYAESEQQRIKLEKEAARAKAHACDKAVYEWVKQNQHTDAGALKKVLTKGALPDMFSGFKRNEVRASIDHLLVEGVLEEVQESGKSPVKLVVKTRLWSPVDEH